MTYVMQAAAGMGAVPGLVLNNPGSFLVRNGLIHTTRPSWSLDTYLVLAASPDGGVLAQRASAWPPGELGPIPAGALELGPVPAGMIRLVSVLGFDAGLWGASNPPPPVRVVDTMSSEYVAYAARAPGGAAPVGEPEVMAIMGDSNPAVVRAAEVLVSTGIPYEGGVVVSEPKKITINPALAVLSAVGVGLGAYHGYKRNRSVGWAIGWAFLGGLFPFVTIPVSLAQGFGKPKGYKSNRRRHVGPPGKASSARAYRAGVWSYTTSHPKKRQRWQLPSAATVDGGLKRHRLSMTSPSNRRGFDRGWNTTWRAEMGGG